MRRHELSDTVDVVEQALALYADDAGAVDLLEQHATRLREPLRLAVAGMVKAGKSTLLNALIGEQIAPTDAGECTRTITWYRYGLTPQITVRLQDGSEELMPVRRSEGRLVMDLGERTAEEVAWIDVRWPSESLRSTVLIDTPGIASLSAETSARSQRFLVPEDSTSVADAIMYLLRHVHASDLNFLEAFRDTAAGASQTVNAVALLSRADEIGSGRIDSLISAARISERYRTDGELHALALDVIPVAGLLAEGARTLREKEFLALRELAGMDKAARERLLVSVDRFTRPSTDTTLPTATRRHLLSRFGIFGVRLGAALIRAGARDSSELSERMLQQSGLRDVQQFVVDQFRARATALKMRGVLQSVEALVRERPRAGDAAVLAQIERLLVGTHELRELRLLAEMRTSGVRLSPTDAEEAERIVGGNGVHPLARLGLGEDATDDEARDRTEQLLAKWRTVAESPLTPRAAVEQTRGVIRSLEGVASELAARGRLGTADDVVASPAPA